MSQASRYLECSAILSLLLPAVGALQLQHRPVEQNPRVVICKTMETHTSHEPAVSVVVFHQRDKADAERLKGLLKKAMDGGAVEIQTSDGSEWRPAAIARLKSCFGRGLLLLPVGTPPPAEGTTFLLRFPVTTLRSE